MKNLFIGLSMAWGNFITIPCPKKKWDSNLKNYMLAWLPFIGAIIGFLWAILTILLIYLGTPYLIMAFVMTFVPFLLSGFMHLDGFMDAVDAIKSRRAIEERQRILKDPHTGSFAVVAAVFIILLDYSAIASGLSTGLEFMNIMIIPVLSRFMAGTFVIFSKPMGQSQYAEGEGAENKGQKKKAFFLSLVLALIPLAIAILFTNNLVNTLILVAVELALTALACLWGKHQLGGMSGDIAGYAITFGEAFGMIIMALV